MSIPRPVFMSLIKVLTTVSGSLWLPSSRFPVRHREGGTRGGSSLLCNFQSEPEVGGRMASLQRECSLPLHSPRWLCSCAGWEDPPGPALGRSCSVWPKYHPLRPVVFLFCHLQSLFPRLYSGEFLRKI